MSDGRNSGREDCTWRRIGSAEKWLRIHNTMEWPDYYADVYVDDLRRFFDCYLKGDDNGWRGTSRVRFSMLDMAGGDRVDQPAESFPPETFAETKLFLDASSEALVRNMPTEDAAAAYDAEHEQVCATFTLRADKPVELVG